MVALNKGKSPFILNMQDITDKNTHLFEIRNLDKKWATYMIGIDNELEGIFR
jgi:hypothetical protein